MTAATGEKPAGAEGVHSDKNVTPTVRARVPCVDSEEHVVAAVVFSVSLGVYSATAYPSVAGGDAGELATVSHTLGVAHPPGYPTMTMLTYAAEAAFFFAGGEPGHFSPGFVQNQFHCFLSALANVALYYAGTRMTGSCGAGMLAASLFGFSPLVWGYSTHIEVFSLNNLLVNVLILLCVLYYRAYAAEMGVAGGVTGRVRIMYLGAFLCGLALTNQHTSILYVAAFILWIFALDWRLIFTEHPVRHVPSLAACLLCGLSPYAYLVLSKLYVPNANSWGETETLEGFATHFFRREYGTFSLASKEADYRAQNFELTWRYYVGDLQTQVGCFWVLKVVAVLLVLKTLVCGDRWGRAEDARVRLTPPVVFALTLFFYLSFFHYFCNLPIERPLFFGVQQRFWIQPLTLTTLLIAYAASTTAECAAARVGVGARHVRKALTLAACLVCAWQVHALYANMDQSGNHIVRDFGRAILAPLPNNSIVLTKGDIMINSARYVQELDGVRRDVRLVDQEMLTYPWCVDSLRRVYSDITFPGSNYFPHRRGSFDIAKFLLANRKRRIFLAHGFKDGDSSWQGRYTAVPFGLIHEVVSERSRQDRSLKALKRYLKSQKGSVPLPVSEGGVMHLPEDGKYAAHTWEQVVKHDYWMAQHNIAYAFLDWHTREAQANPGCTDTKAAKHVAAQEAVRRMEYLAAHEEPPGGIAHRNLGVALQGLLQYAPHDLSLIRRLRDALQGYLVIVKRKPLDATTKASLKNIEEAVAQYTSMLPQNGASN